MADKRIIQKEPRIVGFARTREVGSARWFPEIQSSYQRRGESSLGESTARTGIMIVTLFFWPAVALGVPVAIAGVILRKTTLFLVAAGLVLPASAYLAATPRFEVWGSFPVGFYLLAAMAFRRLEGLPGRTTSVLLIAANAWFFAGLAAEVSRIPLYP